MSNQLLKIGDKVMVFNRYLFAVPIEGVVVEVAKPDNALRVRLNSDNENVMRYSGKFFFQQECRLMQDETKVFNGRNIPEPRAGHILFVNGPFSGQVKSVSFDNHSSDISKPRWLFPERIRCGTKEDETYVLGEIIARGHSSYYYICGDSNKDHKEYDQRIEGLNKRLDWQMMQSMEKDEKIARINNEQIFLLRFCSDLSGVCQERIIKDFNKWKELDGSLDGDKGLVQ